MKYQNKKYCHLFINIEVRVIENDRFENFGVAF